MPLFINVGGGGDYEVGGEIAITSLSSPRIQKRGGPLSIPYGVNTLFGAIEMGNRIRFLYWVTTKPQGSVHYADIDRNSKLIESGRLFTYDQYSYTPTAFYKDRINGGVPIAFEVTGESGARNVFYILTGSGDMKRRIVLEDKESVVFADSNYYVTWQSSPTKRLRQKRLSDDVLVKEVFIDQNHSFGTTMGIASDLIYTSRDERYGSYGARITVSVYDLLTLNQNFSISHSAADTSPPSGGYGGKWYVGISFAKSRFLVKSKTAWTYTGTGGYSRFTDSEAYLLTGRSGSLSSITSFRWERESPSTNYIVRELKSGIGARPALIYLLTYDKRSSEDSYGYRSTTYLTRGNRDVSVVSESQNQENPHDVSPNWRIPLVNALAIDIPGTELTGVFNDSIARYVNRNMAPSVVVESNMVSGLNRAIYNLHSSYATQDGQALYFFLFDGSGSTKVWEIDLIPKHEILK